MKRKLHVCKRALSLLLAAVLTVLAVPAGALAAGEVTATTGVVVTPPDMPEALARSVKAAAQTADFTDYYSQLSARAKKCYNALSQITIEQILAAQTAGNGNRSVDVSGTGAEGAMIQGVLTNGYVNAQYSDAATYSVYQDFHTAIWVLRYDHPEKIWLGECGFLLSLTQVSGSSWKITGVSYQFPLRYNGREKQMYEDMMRNARYIATESMKEADTYSRLRMAHDFLAVNNTYAYDENGNAIGSDRSPLSYTAYSALIPKDDWEPVCSGYANAFKIICDLMGIRCAIIDSENHRWNNVLMDDDYWYIVDVTWDDNAWDDTGEPCYTYFLISPETEINGTRFCDQPDHIEQMLTAGATTDVGLQSVKYPKKNTVPYEYLGYDYAKPKFKDVPRSHYGFTAVEWAADQNITSGAGEGKFLPNKPCNRSEAVTFLWRAMGRVEPTLTGVLFDDVVPGQFYETAVRWAVENEVTAGTGTHTFSPGTTCSRGQIVTFLWRAAGCPEPQTAYTPFVDVVPGAYYGPAVLWAVENGITAGTGDYTFSPDSSCTRVQIVLFLRRFLVDRFETGEAGEETEAEE